MEEKVGIDLIKFAVKTVVDAVEEGQKAMADGRFQLVEIIEFFDDAKAFSQVYSKKSELIAQLKDVDSEERVELFQYLKDEYDAPNERQEVIVERVIDLIEKAFEVYDQGVLDLIEKTKDLIALFKENKS
jgi:hypothetical protein